MAITPKFTREDVKRYLHSYVERLTFAVVESLKKVGEDFIADARLSGSYTDQTGNLRSSIGYLIVINGMVIHSNFSGGQSEGAATGESYARKIAAGFKGKRVVFIGVAGMEYAVFVESTGKEVISSSSSRAISNLTARLDYIKNQIAV